MPPYLPLTPHLERYLRHTGAVTTDEEIKMASLIWTQLQMRKVHLKSKIKSSKYKRSWLSFLTHWEILSASLKLFLESVFWTKLCFNWKFGILCSDRIRGSGHKLKVFPCEGDWAVAQVAQRGCRVSIPGNIQKKIRQTWPNREVWLELR